MSNKITRNAGLEYNVSTIKNNMIKLFENKGYKKREKNDEADEKAMPVFSGSPIAISAAIQKLSEYIVKHVSKITNVDKSGLRLVHRPMVKCSLILDSSLKEYYNYKLEFFDKDDIYAEKIPISKKELEKVISNVSSIIKFNPLAFNLYCFLLYKAYIDITLTAHRFMLYAKKKTLNVDAVVSAIETRFTGNLASEMCTEIKRAMEAASNADDEDDDDEEDDVESEKSKKDSDTESNKKVKKSKKKIETSSDEELDSDSDVSEKKSKKSTKKSHKDDDSDVEKSKKSKKSDNKSSRKSTK
jgi:hypothetical protein